MTYRVVVEPQARLELAEASDWYDAHNPGLGDELLLAFDTALASITANPFRYQVIYGNARRIRLGKFPYRLFYAVTNDEIVVFSCFHSSRNPSRWKARSS